MPFRRRSRNEEGTEQAETATIPRMRAAQMPRKKTYRTPTLVRYGYVGDLTAAGASTARYVSQREESQQ
jgi:hypothetical protein